MALYIPTELNVLQCFACAGRLATTLSLEKLLCYCSCKYWCLIKLNKSMSSLERILAQLHTL